MKSNSLTLRPTPNTLQELKKKLDESKIVSRFLQNQLIGGRKVSTDFFD